MDKLLESLAKALESGNWSYVFLVAAVGLVFNLRTIFDFFERRENRREEFVKDAIKIDAVVGAARSFLEEELNYLLFKKVTGIAANRALREKLKDIVDRSGGEIQTFHLARVRGLLKMKDGKLTIVVGRFERFEWFLNWVLAIAMALSALTFFLLPSSIKGMTFQQLASLMGLGVMFFFFALFLVSQTIPVSAAKWLTPIVERLESRTSEDDG